MVRTKLLLGLIALANLLAVPANAAENENTLEALGTRAGPFCETFERSRSKYVRMLCIGTVTVRWKFTTLLGEPVVNAIARWKGMVGSVLLQTNTEISMDTASAKVQAAFAQVGPTDMLLTTEVVVKPGEGCVRNDYKCYEERRLEERKICGTSGWWNSKTPACQNLFVLKTLRSSYRKAYLILDPGALGRKGKWSFNVAGSPSWGKLFDDSLIRCNSRNASTAARVGFVPAGAAKLVVKAGFTLKNPGGCKISFGGLGELNRALEETCEGYKGDDAAQQRCLEKKKKKKAVRVTVRKQPKTTGEKKPSTGGDEFARQIARAEKGQAPGNPAAKSDAKQGTKQSGDSLGNAISGVEIARENEKRKREEIERKRREAEKQRLVAKRRLIRRRAKQQALVNWQKKQFSKCATGRPFEPLSFTATRRGGCNSACKARGREARRRKAAALRERTARWAARRDQCRAKIKAEYRRRLGDG